MEFLYLLRFGCELSTVLSVDVETQAPRVCCHTNALNYMGQSKFYCEGTVNLNVLVGAAMCKSVI